MKIIKQCIILFFLCFFTILASGCIIKKQQSQEEKNQIKETIKIQEKNKFSTEEKESQKDDPLKVLIKKMTIEEKVGQMFIMGFEGYTMDENITKLLVDKHLGGVILFSRNIDTIEQTRGLIRDLEAANNNKARLFMSLDEEGGTVSRIPKEMGAFEAAWQVGAVNDLNYAFNHGKAIGEAVKSLGFNMDFAPVLDVNSNPNNPVIGGRAFSSDPQVVKNMGTQVFKGIDEAGIISVGKHFPGHGDTDVDSHFGLPIINKTKEELENLELVPFTYAIEKNIPAIMVSHLLLPQLDKEDVASMSKAIVTDLLRGSLNFKGVVITDDMIMEGAKEKFTTVEGTIKAIEAGVDIIIISTDYDEQQGAINYVISAVKEGVISEDRINESVYRILNLKLNYGMIDF